MANEQNPGKKSHENALPAPGSQSGQAGEQDPQSGQPVRWLPDSTGREADPAATAVFRIEPRRLRHFPFTQQEGKWLSSDGRFEIQGEASAGVLGPLYHAWQRDPGRPVALKILQVGRYLTAEEKDRWLRDAQLAAEISHPNLVTTYEVGKWGETLYLAMELVLSDTLSERLRKKPQAHRVAVELVRTLADAVSWLHQKGLFHGNIKPDNIFLVQGDVPKLAEVGLVGLRFELAMNMSDDCPGTPIYLSPEQLRRAKSAIGPSSDVWALGAILYELLAGIPPYAWGTAEEIRTRALNADVVFLRKRNQHIPRALETIVMKCLQKEPSRRYPTAWELAEELGRFLEGKPLQARPVPLWERAAKSLSKNRLRAGTLAAMICAVAATLSILFYQWKHTKLGWMSMVKAEQAARERERETLQLGIFWAKLAQAKGGLHEPAADPARVLATIERVVARVADHLGKPGENPHGFWLSGWGNFYLGRWENAESDLVRAIELDKDFGPAWELLGTIRIRKFLWQTLQERNHAATDSPAEARAKAGPAAAQWNQAKEALETAWRLETDKVAQSLWGLPWMQENEVVKKVAESLYLHFVEGSSVGAQAVLERTHSTFPSGELSNWLGILQEDPRRAVFWQTETIRRMPHYAPAYLDRGVARVHAGDLSGALEDLSKSAQLDPSNVYSLAMRGIVKHRQGDYLAAREALSEAVRMDPGLVLAYLHRARASLKLGDNRIALRDLDEVLTLDPDCMEAYLTRAEMKIQSGDYQGAAEDSGRAIRLAPRDTRGLHLRALARAALQDYQGAIEDNTKALELDPKLTRAYAHRSWLRTKLGDHRGAMDDAQALSSLTQAGLGSETE